MTLIRCPECDQQISDKAESCPHCRYRSPQDHHRSEQPKQEKFPGPVVDELAAKKRLMEDRIWIKQTLAKRTRFSRNRSRLTAIAYICGILLTVITASTYIRHIKQMTVEERQNEEAANKLKNKKEVFNAAKALLASQSSIPMKDLYIIENSLKSVTLDMEEYDEAQSLLNKTNHMLEIARKDMLVEVERAGKNAHKGSKARKRRVKQEEPSSRKKERSTHGGAIARAHSPSSLGLKSFIAAQDPTATLSCYEIGVRFGRCGALASKGWVCNPNDDIAVPLRCRGKAETKRGIEAGVRAIR